MAFGLFRKRLPEPAAPAVARRQAAPSQPIAAPAAVGRGDSAREILELLELELARMIRQLERAANSVAGGARSDRRDARHHPPAHRRADRAHQRRQTTATTFSQAADKFTQSAQGIGAQVRDAGKLADQASAAAQRSPRQCRPPAGILGRDRQCRQPDRADRAADHAAGAQLDHRGGARGRGRQAALRSSPPRSRRWRCRPRTPPRRSPGRSTRCSSDAAGSVDAVHRISQAIEAIRPVFENVNGAVAEQNAHHQRDVRQCRHAHRSSSSRSATAPPKSTAPPRRPKRTAKASPAPARPSPRSRRS